MNTKGETLTLPCANGKDMNYHYVPATGKRRGGFVLLMEIFGVNDNMRRRARELGALGYETLTPNLYDFVEPNFLASYEPEDVKRALALAQTVGVEGGLPGVQAAVQYLKPPVFMGGYCYGGSVAWLAACRIKGLAAVSAFYGRLIVEYINETPQCPIIMHFGKHDETIPLANVEKIQAAHPDVPVYLYDAGHGFCSDRPQHANKEACLLARQRAVNLFQSNEN